MTSRIQTAVTALSKNLKAIERTAKRNPLDAPMRLSQLVLRGALQHNHNLRLSPFELKATIAELLEQHPEWFRYQRSLFYRPTTQAIAKLTPEELEQSYRECNEHCNKWMGGSACVSGDAVLLAKDALGLSAPGERLAEIRKKYKGQDSTK